MEGICSVCGENQLIFKPTALLSICWKPSCKNVWKLIEKLPDEKATPELISEIITQHRDLMKFSLSDK